VDFSPFSCHFIALGSKYSPQHPVLKHLQSVFFLLRDQVSHPHKTGNTEGILIFRGRIHSCMAPSITPI
jgi:hypothetical protein